MLCMQIRNQVSNIWYGFRNSNQSRTIVLILHWFPQHLVGQMLGEKSTTADPMLVKVKPQNGIYLYFASEGRMYNLLSILYCYVMINKMQLYECIQIFITGNIELNKHYRLTK
jgi:hypothetical protein